MTTPTLTPTIRLNVGAVEWAAVILLGCLVLAIIALVRKLAEIQRQIQPLLTSTAVRTLTSF